MWSDTFLPSSSTNLTGLFPQYVYGDVLGYLSAIGSTESQMERVEVPAKPEWQCRAAGECTIDNEQCTMGGEVVVRGCGDVVWGMGWWIG